nr:tripartite tricarboxylate transporter substrate binding protein [Pigmentiphaga litoralis]
MSVIYFSDIGVQTGRERQPRAAPCTAQQETAVKTWTLALAASCTLAVLPGAYAQAPAAYPTKPIRMIVAFPPGGSTDLIARVIAPVMSERLGQQVVVENRGGAGGNIAMEAVARAAPDGYVIGFSGAGALGINGVLYRNMTFDPIKDLTPVGRVAYSPFVLVGPPDAKAKTIADVLAEAKAMPEKLSLGHGGQGTVMQLASELFNQTAGVKTVLVPYKGTGPATVDAMSGQIPLAMSDTPSSVNYIQAGKLKAYAVTTAERSPALPDVPTLAEAGLKGYEATGWFAIAAPTGTPPAIIEKLNGALNAALNNAEVKTRIVAAGATPGPTTPDELRQLIEVDTDKWGKIIKRLNLRLD